MESPASWVKIVTNNAKSNALRIMVALVAAVLVAACLPGTQVLKGSGNTGGTTLSCPECQAFPVSRVIDGDTFQSGGETARLYGVDAPEKGKPCYAEATDRLKELAGNLVRVESGPREEDRYRRMLYYVYTMKPSQNSLFKADTRVRSVAENGILGLVHGWQQH
jgi:endonuclease YncB( thermonuclease family)